MDTHIVVEKPGSGFWRRQFDSSPTKAQNIFDVTFGIAMPVLCFIADPGIIRANGPFVPRDLLLRDYSPFVYSLSAFAITALGLWLSVGRRIRAFTGVFSGILAAGFICSVVIGFLVLPLTIIGLSWVIELLGFTSLVAGFVYCRNAVRSLNESRRCTTKAQSVQLLLLAFGLAVALPALWNFQAARAVTISMEQILQGDEGSIPEAASMLRDLRWYADPDRILAMYERETDPIRRRRLAKAFKIITGEDLEHGGGVIMVEDRVSLL